MHGVKVGMEEDIYPALPFSDKYYFADCVLIVNLGEFAEGDMTLNHFPTFTVLE